MTKVTFVWLFTKKQLYAVLVPMVGITASIPVII